MMDWWEYLIVISFSLSFVGLLRWFENWQIRTGIDLTKPSPKSARSLSDPTPKNTYGFAIEALVVWCFVLLCLIFYKLFIA